MSLAVNELHFSWAANISPATCPASHCSWCGPIFMLSSYFKPRKIIFRGSFCLLGFSCGELHQSASFYRSYFHMPGRKGWERVRNWWTNFFFFFFPSHQKGWEEENSSFQTCSAIPVPVFKSFGNFREENQRTAPAFLEAWMNNFAVDSQVGTIISHSVGPLQKCHIKGCNHINKLRHFTKLPFKGRRDSKPSIRRLQMMNTD